VVDYTLLDRYINIRLMRNEQPSDTDLLIVTPPTGVKQNMQIKGSILPSYTMAQVELRVTNFYTDRDLEEFKYIEIVAGYRGSLSVAFRGQLMVPYIEKPSPDSITVFHMVVGNYTVYNSAYVMREWPAGTSLFSIITSCVGLLKDSGQELVVAFDCEDIYIQEKFVAEGVLVRDVFARLCKLLPNLRIQLDSTRLLVYNSTVGRKDTYTLEKVTMAVKYGSSLSISAPWIPSMRPGDIVTVHPSFYKQGLGSTFVKFSSNDFIVVVIDFVFGTLGQNNMIFQAVNKTDKKLDQDGGYNA